MPSYSLIETVFAEDSEGGCESAFEVFPLFVFIFECGRAREFGHLDFGFGFAQAGFVGGYGGGFVVAVSVGFGHGC
jgi:hypothetical protein